MVLWVIPILRVRVYLSQGLIQFLPPCTLDFSYVRQPALLNILSTSLRPVMKSFILTLLPGLEEETGEFF